MGLFNLFKKKETPLLNLNQQSEPSVIVTENVNTVIPIEKRIKGKSPSCDGLYPHEVLVLSYAEGCYADGSNTFAGFWRYKYGIGNVQAILDSLLNRGFIQIGTLIDAIGAEKLPVIKEHLKKHGEKTSGKKAELIQRLLDSVPEDELSNAFPKRPYALTEEGQIILKKYDWIPYIHARSLDGLDIWNLTEMVQTPPYTSYRDKIWAYFNALGGRYVKNADFGSYRNTRFQMSEFVAEEGRSQIAFHLLCEVVAYDLSGLSNGFNLQFATQNSRFYFPYDKSIVTMAPGITSRIKKYSDEFGWDEETLKLKMKEELSRISLPFRVFETNDCIDIVIAEIYGNSEQLEKIYQSAETRFKKKYRIK